MKKIYFLIAMVTATMLASCTKEQEDFFSDSSANRADAAIAADIQVLTSAANGWLIQYFPESQQSYGGYNIIARFTADGKVEALGEFSEGETSTSLYSVNQSAGLVLSFDTYNEAIHIFSDPAAPLGGDEGKGLEGDYDFSILKATNDEIILKGKKSGNRAIMTPMKSNEWAAYLDEVAAVEEAMYAKKYALTIGSTELVAIPSDRTLVVDYEEDGEEVETIIPYVVTPEGLKFYETVTILGKEFSGFNYAAESDVFPATDNGEVKLSIVKGTLAEQFIEGLWFTSMSNLGAFGQMYWGYCNENVMPVINGAGYPGTLDYFYFGVDDGDFGIFYQIIGYWGLNGVDYQILDDNTVSLTYNPKKNQYNATTFTGAGFLNVAAYFIAPLCADEKGNPVTRTFKLTADDPGNPTWVLLTDVDNPDNTIKMFAEEIYGSLFEK